MGIGCPPLTSVSLLWRIFAILWGGEKKKVSTTSTMEFFENNYPKFPDFDFFFKKLSDFYLRL
jgi:hypothetical protein